MQNVWKKLALSSYDDSIKILAGKGENRLKRQGQVFDKKIYIFIYMCCVSACVCVYFSKIKCKKILNIY